MKLNHLFKWSGTCRTFLIAAFAILGAGALKADNYFTTGGLNYTGANSDTNSGANVNLGNAGLAPSGSHHGWAIFALSGGVTITDPDSFGQPDVFGDVGIAGGGNLTMSLSTIQGDVFRDTGSYNNGGTINGSTTVNYGSYLNPGVTSAQNSSTTAGILNRDIGSGATLLTLSGAVPAGILANNTTALSLNNTPGSITGSADHNYVLNLTDIIMSGANAILTLHGTATTNYLINVNRLMTLGTNSKIVLADGLTAANVMFNVKNNSPGTNYDVTLSGGSVVNGLILAANRNVKLTGASTVYGEVIAKSVSLSGHSQVIVSP